MFTRSVDLADMCLQVIIKNLDLFIFSQTTPQKHIDFLLRLYSEDVFREYKSVKRTIKEDCMLWFLNPHVKKVTLLRKSYSEKIIKQLQVIGSVITSLTLRKSDAPENELNSILCSVPHVMHLDLSSTSCTDKTLSCIQKKCPALVTLNISYCEGVTDDGIQNLCGNNQSLRSLDILGTDVEAFGLCTVLKGMPFLECIKYDDLAGTLVDISDKNRQYNLTELIYDGMDEKPSKIIQAWTKMCPKVKKLHFQFPVERKVLEACTGFKNLEELKIKMSHRYYIDLRVDDVLAPILPISNNLKTLILSCVEIPTVTLVECFKNLENIYLKKVCFTDFKEEDIKTTETKLHTLVIKDSNMEVSSITYKAVTLLISLSKNVTKLYLGHIRNLPDDIFDIILNSMKNLTVVNFSYTIVKKHSIIPFFDIPSMKMVYANNYEDNEGSTIKSALASKSSCTLSWRSMYDSENSDEDSDYNDDADYFDDDDSSDMSDHIISDQCLSTESESDDRYLRFSGNDWYDDYDIDLPWYTGGDW